MLSSRARGLSARLVSVPVRVLARTPISPNLITVLGFALAALAAVLAGRGAFLSAGLVYLGGSLFDLLDGALARLRGEVSALGALLDSLVDRLSESALLLGLLFFYVTDGARTEALLVFAVAVVSYLVSYVRARAEGLGLGCEVGLLARPERVVVLSVGMVAGMLTAALWLLLGLGMVTVGQRVFHVWRQVRAGAQ